jgi:hypothetical protein
MSTYKTKEAKAGNVRMREAREKRRKNATNRKHDVDGMKGPINEEYYYCMSMALGQAGVIDQDESISYCFPLC